MAVGLLGQGKRIYIGNGSLAKLVLPKKEKWTKGVHQIDQIGSEDDLFSVLKWPSIRSPQNALSPTKFPLSDITTLFQFYYYDPVGSRVRHAHFEWASEDLICQSV